MFSKAARLISICGFVLLLNSCRGVGTIVKVQSGPSFLLSGSARLAKFTVYAPRMVIGSDMPSAL